MIAASIGALALACSFIGYRVATEGAATDGGITASLSSGSRPGDAASVDATPAAQVCGKAVLRSPFSYHGRAGHYRSGTVGLPTYGKSHTDFPDDTAGVILPTGVNDYPSYLLNPRTVYYLEPGNHTGGFQADSGDSFVGGYWKGSATVLNGNYVSGGQAIDSNSSIGDQDGVTIEYLTIEKYTPNPDAATINQEANSRWIIRDNTIMLNVPGAGVMLGTGNVLSSDCLTLNGQYGFQAADTIGYDADSLTDGPYNLIVQGNEISYNDTCDFSGLMNNPTMRWVDYDPVPVKYRNSKCGTVHGDGNQGGFKLWQTDGVTIKGNYIHNNWGPGGWADTDNANTTWIDNTITSNEGEGIVEEISYNFSITDNYLANNDWVDGLNNPSFPAPAIYISESGSDPTFGGVPACPERACAAQPSYRSRSFISGNTLVNNGGNIFLWQNSNRFCSDGSDSACTLVNGAAKGPFNVTSCHRNIATAFLNTSSFTSDKTGIPLEDWWDGCMWRTANVTISKNTIDFNPAEISACDASAWADCGAGGIFSEYGGPAQRVPAWAVPTQLTFFQGDIWTGNVYRGPSTFYVWNQGNGDSPVSWADWTGRLSFGDKCGSSGERHSGYCDGPFGQDKGGSYVFQPPA